MVGVALFQALLSLEATLCTNHLVYFKAIVLSKFESSPIFYCVSVGDIFLVHITILESLL